MKSYLNRITKQILKQLLPPICTDWFRRFRTNKVRNVVVDEVLQPLPDDELLRAFPESVETLNFSACDIWYWLKSNIQTFENMDTYGANQWHALPYIHKKALEYLVSYTLLDVKPSDVFMDVGAQRSHYYRMLSCKQIYLQDLAYPISVNKISGTISEVGGDAANIPLPDGSVDTIALHHSFEHFEGESDIKFACECSRLLNNGGRFCIVPIFITTEYTEVHRDKHALYDPRARHVYDDTTTIAAPFARFYDLRALQERVITSFPTDKFSITIYRIQIDGQNAPDMTQNYGARVNENMRALLIERSA